MDFSVRKSGLLTALGGPCRVPSLGKKPLSFLSFQGSFFITKTKTKGSLG
jgi:hypothetical protein